MFATPPRVAAAFSDSPLSAIATQRKRRTTAAMDGYDSGHAAVDDVEAQVVDAGDATMPGDDEGDVFEVEAIIGRQGGRNGRPLEYCVRWKGYTPDDDTWVLREDIMADDLVQEYNAKHPLPVPTPRKKRKRDVTTSQKSTSQDRSSSTSASTSLNPRKRRHTEDEKPLFYKSLPEVVCESIIPVSTAVCEPSFARLLRKLSPSSNLQQMIAIHPATFVVLRMKDHSALVRPFIKPALAILVDGISDETIAMLDRGTCPKSSPFADTDAQMYIDGGPAFDLTWHWGFHNVDEEIYHIISTIAHLQQSQLLPKNMKLRMLVRKIKPNLRDACRHYGIDVIDMFDLRQELRD